MVAEWQEGDGGHSLQDARGRQHLHFVDFGDSARGFRQVRVRRDK